MTGMGNVKLGLALTLAATLVPSAVQASPGEAARQALRNSDSREMLAANGRRYQIRMAWPDAPPPPQGYPVLYVLDADRMFGTMVDTVRNQEARLRGTAPAVIIGIGYPRDLDAGVERVYDLTARLGSPEPSLPGTGGAEGLMAFISDRLKPAVAQRVRIDPERETIVGHGFGGHFVLYALVNHPDMFDSWYASSPAIWLEKRLLAKDNVRKRLGPKLEVKRVAPQVLLTIGESASGDSPDFPPLSQGDAAHQKSVDDVREYASFLSGLSAIDAKFEIVAGDVDDVSAAIVRGVRFAMAPRDGKSAIAPRRTPLANPSPLPVPDRDHYMAMNAEERYALRIRSRALPEAQRKLWGEAFDHMLNAGLTYAEHRALAEEREAMDLKYGTTPHPD